MRRGLLVLAVGSSLALGGCVHGDWGMHARATVSETRALAKDGSFELDNTNGRIEVTGWDEAKVAIEATKRAVSERALDRIKVEITGEGDTLRVRTRFERGSWFGGGGRVDYVVRVPRTAKVRIENVNGRVEVDGVTAEVAASTTNGSVEVTGAEGAVDASVVNGTVSVALARVDPQGRSEMSTTNGSVRLTLPADANAEIDARTVNGGIGCDFDLADETRARRRLEGRIGSGGARFELRTVNGAVNIDRGPSARSASSPPAEATPEARSR
jgi:putative adhesin